MRSLWCAVAVLVSSSAMGAATFCVDGRNLSGMADGSAARPFVTVQAAVDAAVAGDTVAVAAGHCREAVHVRGKGLFLLGGFAGAASYDGTAAGDFSTRSGDPSATWIEGVRTAPVMRLTDAPASTLDGFRITGGQRGVLVDDEAWPSIVADVVISHNFVEDNLRSRAGRWSPALATWVHDSDSSPAIDAGDAARPFDLEPEPNGGRLNLGFEGNTPEASKSDSGLGPRARRRLGRAGGG